MAPQITKINMKEQRNKEEKYTIPGLALKRQEANMLDKENERKISDILMTFKRENINLSRSYHIIDDNVTRTRTEKARREGRKKKIKRRRKRRN